MVNGVVRDNYKDNCTCAPTSKTQSVVCEEPLKGTKTEKSNWTCTTPKSGVWSNWTTESSNCYTPCKPLAAETQTLSCDPGYSGSITQTRTSSCSGDDSKPPTWSSWNTVSSNCVEDLAPPADNGGGGCYGAEVSEVFDSMYYDGKGGYGVCQRQVITCMYGNWSYVIGNININCPY